jgi:hypothetical protein
LRFEREAALLAHVGRAGDDVVDLPLLHWERHRNCVQLYGEREPMREVGKRLAQSKARAISCCVPVARLASLRTTKEFLWNPGMRLAGPAAFWSTAMTDSTTNSFWLSVCAHCMAR